MALKLYTVRAHVEALILAASREQAEKLAEEVARLEFIDFEINEYSELPRGWKSTTLVYNRDERGLQDDITVEQAFRKCGMRLRKKRGEDDE